MTAKEFLRRTTKIRKEIDELENRIGYVANFGSVCEEWEGGET